VSTSRVAHAEEPYLSVVVTARNDDHGGDPLYRMQVFIDSLLRQCESYRLPSELIIVEWNPPEDRPRLGDVLSWPETAGWCAVRIIEVPHEVHSRLEHAESLPLFQMIAKNVGIRRARGLFVLATNIDLLFDDALIRRIASRRLQGGRLYRVDRYDVPATIDAAPDEWLEWSRRSVMRVHSAHGSIDARTGDFYPIGRHSRTAQAIRAAVGRRPRLLLAIREAQAKADELLDRAAVRHTTVEAARRAKQTGGNASALTTSLGLLTQRAALAVRAVGFYVGVTLVLLRDLIWLLRAFTYWFWCGIREPRLAPRRAARRFRRIGHGLVSWARALLGGARAQDLAGVSRRDVRGTEFARIQGVLQGMLAAWHVRRAMPPLHTNGCGDFTLMTRTDWVRTRAYPELQRFSMHIDGLFVYQAHYARIRERFLPYPIFHIEHGAGFRPDISSVRELDQRLERDRIRRITDTEFLEWVVEMRSTSGPLAFNDDNWGLGGDALSEYDPTRAATMVAQ
jgi:hypothetical protein